MVEQFEGKSDHDLLIVAVTKLEGIEIHVASLDEKAGEQNGRLAALEQQQLDEDIPDRISALEHWRIGLSLVLGFVSVSWPLLIFEVRQFLFEKFGFI